MKGINSIFPSTKVEFSVEFKNVIKDYINEYAVDIKDESEFFNVGNLLKQTQPIAAGPFNTGPSFTLVGSEEEKGKYELLRKLYWKIIEYQQYSNYLTDLESKFFLELALSNFGTRYDEDVDVKLFIRKGSLCLPRNLAFPGDQILPMANKIFQGTFRPSKTVSVTEYGDYPVYPPTVRLPVGLREDDDVKYEEEEYITNLKSTFCYEFFHDDEHDIISYNQPYVKQNTSVFLPSILLFNSVPDKIKYEISSKHYPELVTGELSVIT